MPIKIEYLEEKEPVYDINVEGNHNFFANRILVHNCTESFANVQAGELAHTCNLLSIVVGRIDSDDEMIEMSRLGTRILDNGITLTDNPIIESKKHNQRYRTIGVGIQGLHDYVAKNDLSWSDYPALTKVAELIEYGCVSESIQLAKECGKYPAFEGSKWDTGELVANFKKYSVTDLDWDNIAFGIKEFGIRNSQLTSPAPNTSSSIFMDASAGVMPVWASFYNEDNKTGKFSVHGMYLKDKPLAYERNQPRMHQTDLAKLVGHLQRFVDTGISAEYVFDWNRSDVDAKSLYELINVAWKEKTKAIYYIRSIKKGESIDTLLDVETVCAGCTG